MSDERWEQIVSRHQSATPGPYSWWGNTDQHSCELAAKDGRGTCVMALHRWGARGAQPMFRDHEKHFLVDVAEIAVFEVDYRNDFFEIDNPDAEALMHSWQDKEDLIAEVLTLRKRVAVLERSEADRDYWLSVR